MELSKDAARVVNEAIGFAEQNKLEYVTPEMLLLMIIKNPLFVKAYRECGGDENVLKSNLLDYIENYVEKTETRKPVLSAGTSQVINFAGHSAYNSGNDFIEIRHFLHAIWNLTESHCVYFMEKFGVTEIDLLQGMADMEEDIPGDIPGDEPEDESLSYAPCLNDTLTDVNPLIGRKEELSRTIQILCRKDKNNPLHIGEPGVGKTAITHGLVQLINEGKVPKELKNARVYALDLGGILAGTKYRGDFEKRLKKFLAMLGKEELPIVYIDEIHNLTGAGAVGEGSFDASNLLKPYLAQGHIRFIGATTFEEYKKYFEKNKSLVRRFQNVEIAEPSIEETVEILKGLAPKYGEYHGVKYAEGILEYMATMSHKLINERHLPDKAIDLMDEAGAYKKLNPGKRKSKNVDTETVNTVLTKICRIPVETVEAGNVSGLKTLEPRLKSMVYGQEEAIAQVVNAVKFSKAGLLEEDKPLASLLFVGPTGVGKTEIAKSLSRELGIKLIRFDMSEYGEKHSISKLIGSPAGYVGYEEGGLLTEAIRKSPQAVLLLDEIEKAHPDIFNILLQVMDYATLTDNQGRKADFRNIIIIMTSNAGASRLGKQGIGFKSEGMDNSVIMEEVKRTFQPEFRNRLSKIVVFNPMDEAMADLIVDKKLKELNAILAPKNISISANKKAKTLIRKKGITAEYGAREIDRIINSEIKPLFVDEILFGKLKEGGKVKLEARDGEFTVA